MVLWHSPHTPLSSPLHTLPRPAVVLRVVSIYFHFRSRDGVWQTPRLPPFHLPACPPLSASPSMTDAFNRLAKEVKQNTKGRQPVSYTQGQEQLYVMCRSLEKEKQRSWRQGAFSNKILSWMSIHFKARSKEKTLGCVSRCLYTKALAPLSTFFQRARDTLALISVRQRPLSWQFFQGRLNLHLRECLSLSSLLRQNKRLLK